MEKLNRIKEVLNKKGIMQKEFADRVDVSKYTLNRWCSNFHQPSLIMLFRIADVLDVSVCELLEVKDKK